MRLYGILGSIVLAIAALAISGCHRATNIPPSTAGRVEYTDEIGRRVEIAPNPQRIVSLAPSLTETLFAIGAGKQVVGVTSYCDYPAEAKKIAKVGDTINPSLERVAALRPDLVLITTSSQLEEFARRLASLGVPLYVSNPKSLEEVVQSVRRLGQITGHAGEANKVADRITSRSMELTQRVGSLSKRRVFFVVGLEPLFTIGRGAYLTDLIERAGGESITRSIAQAWPQYSREAVIARKPEVIVAGGETETFERVTDKWAEMFAGTPAHLHGEIYRVNGDLLQRPSPRIIDGVELLARILHPDAFKESQKADR